MKELRRGAGVDKPSKKITIITLGCAKNQVDSEALWSQLEGNDLEVTSEISEASIAVINTCGFIDEAKKQSVDTILETIKLKNEGKLEKVIVMGCLSERYHNDLAKEIPEVDRFFGSNDAPMIVNELGGNYKYELLGERQLSTPQYSAYLKISEGCDNPCSFCAIPIMRGVHRSKPVGEVMDEVMKLVNKGVKELIVIGQDTTYYGTGPLRSKEARVTAQLTGQCERTRMGPVDVRVPGKISSRHPAGFSGESENLPVPRHADPTCFR